jgi:hypothetical protein
MDINRKRVREKDRKGDKQKEKQIKKHRENLYRGNQKEAKS